jgi:UDP-N-acetylglucosamine--N-acetylmuramyl-(pentapeptide) pyrophosphoryl-undecaprenol N-acetylglucosamine transferase
MVIAAGGTGGHLFPAEALAAELSGRGQRVALMTDARSLAYASRGFANHERHVLAGAGLAGRGVVRGAVGVASMAVGVAQARRLLVRDEPCAIVGFGGYPSVAPVLASRSLRHRPPVVLHEQNAVLGRANRFMARWADALALSVPETARVPAGANAVVTGNPVRPAMLGLADVPYAPAGQDVCLLVIGGSLGARVFSDVVGPAIMLLPPVLQARVKVVQQCRAEDLERVRAAYRTGHVDAELAPFFPDMAERMSCAHLVIARAGASTVAELALAGRPSILVPLPAAIDDHQRLNARALERAGAAWVMEQPAFTPDSLAAKLTSLLTGGSALIDAAEAARSLGQRDAARKLADLVETVVAQRVNP